MHCHRNPVGRTGMIGRGLLGRWGPNHAVDPIVSRWKRDAKGSKIIADGKPVLEFVAILRNDTRDWAIPGVSLCCCGSHTRTRTHAHTHMHTRTHTHSHTRTHTHTHTPVGDGRSRGHCVSNTKERVWRGSNEQFGGNRRGEKGDRRTSQ